MRHTFERTRNTRIKLWIPLLAVAALLAGLGRFCAEWRAGNADADLRARLLRQVVQISRAINPDLARKLTFTEADKGSPAYERLREQMTAYGRLIPQRGIYSMALRNGALLFGPENYAGDDPMASSPGTVHQKPAPENYEVFAKGKPVTIGPVTDEFGTFVSALAPVFDPRTGEVLMVVGMDIPADDWQAAVNAARRGPELITFLILLLILLVAGCIYWRNRLIMAHALPLRHMETVLIGVLGLTLTAVTTWLLREAEQREQARIFVEYSDSRMEAIQSVFRGIREDLASIARFCEASQHIDRQEFATFAEPLARSSTVEGYQWVALVPEKERARFEAEVQSEEFVDFPIWEKTAQGDQCRPLRRTVYFPVHYVAPWIDNKKDVGFDMGSEPLHRAAIDKAVATGLPTAVNPISMLPDGVEGPGMLVMQPVFAQETHSGKARNGAGPGRPLRGFAAGILRLQDILKVELTQFAAEVSFMDVCLLDLMGPQGPTLLATYPYERASNRPAIVDEDYLHRSPLTQIFPVFAFGRAFALVYHPTSEFYALHPLRQGWMGGCAGLFMTIVLTLFVGFLRNRQAYLESQVKARTAEVDEREKQFRDLFENALSGIALCEIVPDEHGNPVDYIYLHANAAFEEHTGLRVADILGKRATQVRPGIENTSLLQMFGKVAMGGEAVAFELFLEPAQHYYSINAYPMGEGRFAFVLFNITERKRAEEAVLELAGRLQHYLSISPIITYALKIEGDGIQSTWVSENIQEILGYTVEEALKPGWWAMHLHPGDREEVLKNTTHLFEKGNLTHEYRFLRKDGSILWINDQLQITKDNSGDAKEVVGAWTDITAQKEAEAEFKKLEAQFHQAQKMEAVGRLAGGVAHDFNNMLGVIQGYTELALMELTGQDSVRNHLEEVMSAANRSADLVRHLLAFARRQTVSPVVLNLNDTLSGMLKMFRRIIGEDIELAWIPGHELWEVKIDPSQIDQILANLVVNARDAIAGAGKITIETDNVKLDPAYCAVHAECIPGEYVRLAVSDDGCGMEREMLTKIFEPFFTTKELGKGTGLGLSTVFGIVKQNGGCINVYSEPEKGTTFKIYLPRFKAGHIDAAVESEAAAPHRGTETVLLVEDEKAMLELAKEMLQRLGYAVLCAGTPQTAMRLLAGEYSGPVHLLITDVVMPEMNGRELAKKLKPIQPNMKVLYMSGYTADVIAHRGVLEKGVNFIQKPFSMKSLAEKVRKALED